MTHQAEVQAILAGARAERAALLAQLSPALQASLPVDATGISQALDHLGDAAGLDVHREQVEAHKTNAAVLHGRVFGRAPLSADTVLAAFVDGARVRAGMLTHLADAVGGEELVIDVGRVLERHPPDRDLPAAYEAQEHAAVVIARHLDEAAR
ncbi:hypothetical protein OJ997_14790 [Solirubrobacter phytolaccae]|uniref:Uncharacterized protein n=1 Tax=Solirubrobacter phytolaccae TaxID=1404360 RepID=A0A9X3NAM8_9ACTN|nr:hypothetical protein [Solirubrobacter phytolaccae]MDA0181569.1 hypothetical protein [Solirubrobacter phytolaccae]